MLVLAATTLPSSLWALPFPRSFYDDFPLPGADWVSTLGPYDEHLVRDYGALNLALGILLAVAAVYLDRRLTRVALAAWLGYAVPHFVYHTTVVDRFPFVENLAQLTSLGTQVVLPLALLLATRVSPRKRGQAAANDPEAARQTSTTTRSRAARLSRSPSP